MITYDKRFGCWFQMDENSRHYALYEMMSYKHNSTSDIVVIFDHDHDSIVNYVYGANVLCVDELDKAVSEYVEEYEAMARGEAKVGCSASYRFTKAGVKAFLENASKDFFEEMDHELENQDLSKFDIVISCGKHKIRIPLGAEEWNCVEEMLEDCLEVNE